jgi:hypothetical protein
LLSAAPTGMDRTFSGITWRVNGIEQPWLPSIRCLNPMWQGVAVAGRYMGNPRATQRLGSRPHAPPNGSLVPSSHLPLPITCLWSCSCFATSSPALGRHLALGRLWGGFGVAIDWLSTGFGRLCPALWMAFPHGAHPKTGDLPGDWDGFKANAANSIGTEAFAHCGAEQTETTALPTPQGEVRMPAHRSIGPTLAWSVEACYHQ